MAHRWGDGRLWRRLGRKVMWTEEQSVQVAGGQRRARKWGLGKGGMKVGREARGGQEEGSGAGGWQGRGSRVLPGDQCGGGLAGSIPTGLVGAAAGDGPLAGRGG